MIAAEYASRGDLYDYISGRQRLSEREARHFFRQIVSAVALLPPGGRALGPGLAFPERPRDLPDHTGSETKARWECWRVLASSLLAGVGRTHGLLYRGKLLGSLPVCAYPTFHASSLSRLGLHVRLPSWPSPDPLPSLFQNGAVHRISNWRISSRCQRKYQGEPHFLFKTAPHPFPRLPALAPPKHLLVSRRFQEELSPGKDSATLHFSTSFCGLKTEAS